MSVVCIRPPLVAGQAPLHERQKIVRTVAVIGAGAAGLAAARTLRQRPGITVALYERGAALGGRLATGRREGFIFDHGAQNLRAPTPALERLLRDELAADGLRDIGLPVWLFSGAGAITPGDPALNAEAKWIYRGGIGQLTDRLAEGLDVRRETPVAALAPSHDRWLLSGDANQPLGAADAVLLTPPAPEAAAILAASTLGAELRQTLLDALGRARYRRCVSLALAYAVRVERPFYALLNIDRAHPIAWLALEHAKAPERCPPGHSLLMAQMSPRWSDEHWDATPAAAEQLVAPLVASLLGDGLGAPLWSDIARWPYALPDSGADFDTLNGSGSGLFFAGDYTAGLGRVHLAIESGWRAAAAIERWLGTQHTHA